MDINEKDENKDIITQESDEAVISDDEKSVENTDSTEIIESEPIISFNYTVTNEEENKAFLIFQRKYVYKHNWKVTAAFGAVALLFVISIIRNPTGYLNWVLLFFSLFMIFMVWFNTANVRKYLVGALKTLEKDEYCFTLYDDCFKIETIFTEEEMSEEDFVPVKPRIVRFEDISLNVIENDEMFIIILKKETIYVLSKRVIDSDNSEILRKHFSEILGEDYERRINE